MADAKKIVAALTDGKFGSDTFPAFQAAGDAAGVASAEDLLAWLAGVDAPWKRELVAFFA